MGQDYIIGVDISKDNLDAYRQSDSIYKQFANTPAGIRQLLKWSKGHSLVMEPTARYHRPLEAALHKAERPLYLVNPERARYFARSDAKFAKTDRIDAEMLACMPAALRSLQVTPPPHPALPGLRELWAAHEAQTKQKTRLKNQSQQATLPLLKKQHKRDLKAVEKNLAEIMAEMRRIIAEHEELVHKAELLMSIKGVGEITAIALLIDLPELGSLTGKQAAALVGLAPITRQSGKWQGKSFIQKGRRKLRCALFMPALVVIRYNAPLKRIYDAMIARGKPKKLAITAIMRRIVTTANALIRDNRKWSETTP